MDFFERKHHFPSMAAAIETHILYENVVELGQWKEQLNVLASKQDTLIRFPDTDKFYGDAFEHLVESIIRFYCDDQHVDCAELEPAPENAPGVDFIGKALDGTVHTIQCKYRSDKNALLSNKSDGIGMFPATSLTKYEAKVMSVWTTAKGLHPAIEEAFNNKIKTFGHFEIEYLVNHRYDFWDFYAKEFGRSRKRKSKTSIGRLDNSSFELRDYQKQGFENFKAVYEISPLYEGCDNAQNIRTMKGRFIYPTGAGKTVIQSLILKDMISKKGGTRIHVVVAPRIVLVNQLLSEYRHLLGTTYLGMAFHSGNKELDYEKISWVERSTTQATEVLKQRNRAVAMGKDLVIFSTYHSLWKLVKQGIVFDTMIADESQYCIREDNFSDVRDIRAAVKLFFTATERHGLGERSNDNEVVFGPVIGQETVSNLINQQYLVRPVLHVVAGKRRDKELDSFVDEAAHVARFQRVEVHEKMSSRTLFACSSTKDVKAIVDYMSLVKEKLPDHDVFTIVSDSTYSSRVNGDKVSRDRFMNDLHFCQNNAMIFHYDILSEGIDIDGITGCAIMRRMGHAKLVQTIGRCLRVFKKNPSTKERALISVPVIDGDKKNRDHIREVVRMLMEGGFEVNIEEMVVSGGDGTGREPGTPEEYEQTKLDLRKRLQTTIKEVIHEIEDDYRQENLKIFETKTTQDVLRRLTDSIEGVTPDWKERDLSHSDSNTDIDSFRDDEIETILRIVTKRSDGHNIPTPKKLASRMIREIGHSIDRQWDGKRIAVMYNMEFVDALRCEGNVNLDDVTYFGDCSNKEIAMTAMGSNCKDVEELRDWSGEKFDVVVGNPPYQSSSNTGNPIWPKFAEQAIEISDGGGYYRLDTPA